MSELFECGRMTPRNGAAGLVLGIVGAIFPVLLQVLFDVRLAPIIATLVAFLLTYRTNLVPLVEECSVPVPRPPV